MITQSIKQSITFDLPQSLNATIPPERRGVRRDFVRMMVLDRNSGNTSHTQFYKLDQYLRSGDLLVLNVSRTVPAVLKAKWGRNGLQLKSDIEVRLAHCINDSNWEALVVSEEIAYGDILHFSPTLQAVVLESKHKPFVNLLFSAKGSALYDEIYGLGEPVRYEYIEYPWELDYYQTVYASVPGSVEMPSAGRAFSWELLFRLQRKGIRISYIQLHTGLSYLLDDSIDIGPSDNYESYEVPYETAAAIKQTKESGGRVIAVGTTVVRSLETAVNEEGKVRAQSGWTNLYIHANFPLKAVDGLITGFHEPEAFHLDLLSAFIDQESLNSAYQEAIQQRYLWHEFGDMNLIL